MEVKEGYKLTELGVIPEDWSVDTVGNSFDICNGLRLPISRAVRRSMSGPFAYYGPTNIQDWINEYRVDGEYALIGEDGDHFLKWKIQPMTLLVNGKFNVNNHAHLVKGKSNLTKWFYWYFSNRDLTSYLTRQGASRYKLTKASLTQIPCALPRVQEQKAITAALDDVDALLDGLDRLIAKKRDIKQAAMQGLLMGPSDTVDSGKLKVDSDTAHCGFSHSSVRLPGFDGGWETKRLGDLATLINGRAYALSEWKTQGTPVIRLQNLTGRGLEYYYSDLSLPDKQYCEEGDLLYMWSATFGPVIWRGTRAIFHYHIWKIECKKDQLDRAFLYHFLCDTTERLKNSTTSGGTMLHLTKGGMENMQLSVPTYAEQIEIASVLSDLDTEIESLEQRRDKTRDLKQAMMQELLTGRTRLVDFEELPVEGEVAGR